jgi:nicotinate-nucleotide pyrophosphorylase (carboxylating)
MTLISKDLQFIRLALYEDIGKGDITTRALCLKNRGGKAAVISKSSGVISGLEQFKTVFKLLSSNITFKLIGKNGQKVSPGDEVIRIKGSLETLLTGERTAMNILSHLSGVATLTSQFVERAKGLPVRILDTRKTMPGMRNWEKEAVRHGGGNNHRRGLYDMYLVKENHIAAAGGLREALEKTMDHRKKTGVKVEVEVRSLSELKTVLPFKPDYILLDNFSAARLRKAVVLAKSASRKSILEASGNINLKNIKIISSTGVDRISIGALTHSAPALDLSFRILD